MAGRLGAIGTATADLTRLPGDAPTAPLPACPSGRGPGRGGGQGAEWEGPDTPGRNTAHRVPGNNAGQHLFVSVTHSRFYHFRVFCNLNFRALYTLEMLAIRPLYVS